VTAQKPETVGDSTLNT